MNKTSISTTSDGFITSHEFFGFSLQLPVLQKLDFYSFKQTIKSLAGSYSDFMSLNRKCSFTEDWSYTGRMFTFLINFLIGPVHCSRNTLNGDLASATIPEESRFMAKKKSESEDPLLSFSS